jgi:hypothetical protein
MIALEPQTPLGKRARRIEQRNREVCQSIISLDSIPETAARFNVSTRTVEMIAKAYHIRKRYVFDHPRIV